MADTSPTPDLPENIDRLRSLLDQNFTFAVYRAEFDEIAIDTPGPYRVSMGKRASDNPKRQVLVGSGSTPEQAWADLLSAPDDIVELCR